MKIQIENILIWQKSGDLRNLELKRNSVNVITGESGKGKSSILHIIDYCLLSSDANGISKANIDDKTNWYGLRLSTSAGLITVARPAYHRNETDELYFCDDGGIPDLPVKNMKVASLKKVLDKEFGLDSELKVPYGGRTIRAGSKVSFRNFLSYCYQDQNAIVAPDYIFNSPSNLKVLERIERTFKMAIGIVDIEGAIVNERLEKLKADKSSLERRSELIGNKRLEFHEDVLSLEAEAISLGLLNKPSDDIETSLGLLQTIVDSPLERFDNIDEQLKELEQKQLELNRKLRQFTKFNEGYREYQSLLKQSDDSIQPVSYLIERYKEILPGTKTSSVLQVLEEELLTVKESWKKRNQSLLYVDVDEKTKEIEKELNIVKSSIEETRNLSSKISSPREIYKYQGKLGVKVDLYSGKANPIDYSSKIDDIDDKIEQLNGVVQNMESKREFIMANLNIKLNNHLSRLKLKGYENAQAIFLEKDRSINLILDEGRSVEKMIDIGSASNYLYLHLSFFMAIHELALDNQVSWMPSFIVFDQVSTPYTLENSDDIASLDVALKELNDYVESMKEKGGIQIILMEHLHESHWKNLKLNNFRLVDKELIGDYGLIN